jgi:D-alanyl-D-alanine carboxypeptidase
LAFESVTKVATAGLALRLAEQGKLSLDDPIGKWYREWRGDPHATVRDLLGHHAGTGDSRAFYTRLLRHPSATVTPRQLIAAAPSPGPRTSKADYNDTGFVIAGLILQRVAGEPVATAMRRELFAHPGGAGLALQPTETAHTPRAHGYWYPRGLGEPVDNSDGGPIMPFRAAAATSTAAALAGDVPSLARWGDELFRGHVLKPDSLEEMAQFHPGGFWEAYGLGLARDTIDGHLAWGHGGDAFGSRTEFWHLPRERLTIAITWNDDALEREGNILPELVRLALGTH